MLSLSLLTLLISGVSAAAVAGPYDWPSHGWGNGASGLRNGSSQEAQCGPAVVALATGIEINIVAQHGELNGTLALLAIENATTVNSTAFLLAKGALVSDVMGGISIREFTQGLIPQAVAENPGSAAVIAGYSGTYASAQMTELALAQSLTGVPAHDLPILAMLKSDVTTGIQLNMNNSAAAVTGCNVGVVFPATD